MQTSLFRRITRYSVAASIDPRENRLTEATAATLERVDGLARSFALSLLTAARDDAKRRGLPLEERDRRARALASLEALEMPRVDVRIQVVTPDRRGFVDLEVRLRSPIGSPEAGVLLWIEVKHGAGLHGDQLDIYDAAIRSAHPADGASERLVVLVAPRDSAPPDAELPVGVVLARWHEVARALDRARDAGLPAGERWLLDEYLAYLREEGLMDPDALTASSALALMEADAGAAAAAGICEVADGHVRELWARPRHFRRVGGGAGSPSFGPGYWATYAVDRTGTDQTPWEGAWFEWGLRRVEDMRDVEPRRGSWAFIAGATFPAKDDRTTRSRNAEWRERHAADGFASFSVGGYDRLARLRYPDELLAMTTLEDQGLALAEWVVNAFKALSADPPQEGT